MMATAYHSQNPALLFQKLRKIFPRYGLQTAISNILSLSVVFISFMSMDKQPSTASYMFFKSSSNVSLWVAQPGIEGTSARYPPSSASWIITLIFMLYSPNFIGAQRVRKPPGDLPNTTQFYTKKLAKNRAAYPPPKAGRVNAWLGGRSFYPSSLCTWLNRA